jgi:poly-gamma-glutamate synthesis protein (capsule biosynthesis protein)
MFSEVTSQIESSDLAICSLEGPIAPAGVPYSGSPRFASPAAIAQSIKDVGYDRCTIATNHSNDRGADGIRATIDAFDAVGLGHSGSGKDEAGTTAEVFAVNGVRVAHLAYTFGVSGLQRLLTKSSTRVNILTASRVIADATEARVRGAEVVLVSLHWGVEYQSAITSSQSRLARQITASGQVDLIAGSHAHVLQPIKQVNGKWVLFGLGNHLSTQNALTIGRPSAADGVLVTVRLTEQPGGGFAADRPVVTPTWVHNRQYYIMDISRHLGDTTLSRQIRGCIRAAWRRITTLYGDLVPPLTP